MYIAHIIHTHTLSLIHLHVHGTLCRHTHTHTHTHSLSLSLSLSVPHSLSHPPLSLPSFSSYPGVLYCGDDFYQLSSKYLVSHTCTLYTYTAHLPFLHSRTEWCFWRSSGLGTENGVGCESWSTSQDIIFSAHIHYLSSPSRVQLKRSRLC